MPYTDKDRAYTKEYYAKNKVKRLAQAAEWHRKNRARVLECKTKYRLSEKGQQTIKAQRVTYKHRALLLARVVCKKNVASLADAYVRERLGLKKNAPRSLVELKRAQLMGLRMLKEKTK